MLEFYLNMISHKNHPELIIISIVVSLLAAALLFTAASLGNTPVSILIRNLTNNLLRNNENIFIVQKINNVNIYLYIYLLLALSIPLTILFTKIRDKGRLHIIFLTALAVFFLSAGIQTVNQVKKAALEFKTFSGKTLPEKNSLVFGLPYNFAGFCRKRLPGKSRGSFITGLDRQRDPGMTWHRRLAYHLYPINTRIPTEQTIDCYIAFQKKDSLKAIPEDFNRLYVFDQLNLLAVKTESKK